MAPGHLPFNLAIRIGQLARGPLGRPEDSELVVHHLLDRFTGADLTETLSRIEGTERKSFRNQAEARMAVFDFIEAWYNPHRRHSALGQMSPLNYEKEYANTA